MNEPDPKPATPDDDGLLYPLQAVAAWALPGAGHFLHGQRARGMVIGSAILLLWLWGWLIGGLTSFDRREHPVWFGCQIMMAPSIAATAMLDLRQPTAKSFFQPAPKVPPPSPDAPFEPSYGRSNELGILFTALAGLLNVLAICDAGLSARRRPAAPANAPATPPASPPAARWSTAWTRLALGSGVLVAAGLAWPIRLFAASPHADTLPPYRPFIDPMPWNDSYWLLTIVPLSLAVSLVYRAVRCEDLSEVPRASILMTAQIVGAMALLSLLIWALTLWV